MTMTVKREGLPDRQACERCRCEIGVIDNDGMLRPFKTYEDQGESSVPTRDLLDAEPLVAFDPACSCTCHDAFRMFHGQEITPREVAA